MIVSPVVGRASIHLLDDGLLVDGHGDGLTHGVIAQGRQGVGLRALPTEVEGQVQPPVRDHFLDLDGLDAVHGFDELRLDAVRDVDLPIAQGLDHGLLVREELELDPVDLRLGSPEVGIALHGPALPLLPSRQRERAAPDARRVPHIPDLAQTGADVRLPHLLGDDVDPGRHVRCEGGCLRLPDQRPLVRCLERGALAEVAPELRDLVVDHEAVAEGHVAGGQRRTIAPPKPLPQGARPFGGIGVRPHNRSPGWALG